jgi:hypothetical protein
MTGYEGDTVDTEAKIIAALKLAIDCIIEAAKIAGPVGAPSGVVYAALSEHGMTLTVYEQIVDYLVKSGKIKVEYHCIKLA